MGIASPLSIGATALSGFGKAFSSIQSGQQQSEMDAFQAQKLANAAEYGQTAAAQTDMTMRQQLQQVLGTMAATRASANTEAGSPTGAAILERTQGQGDQQRGIQVGNALAQAGEDQSESAMYTTAANQTITDSFLNAGLEAGGALLGGLAAPVATGPTVGGSLWSSISGIKFRMG